MAIFFSVLITLGALIAFIFVPFLIGRFFNALVGEDDGFGDDWVTGMAVIVCSAIAVAIFIAVATIIILPIVQSWGIK